MRLSCEHVVDDDAFVDRGAFRTALMDIDELIVVKAHECKNCRMQLGFLNVIPYLGSMLGLVITLPLAYFQDGGGILTLVGVIVVLAFVQTIEGYLLMHSSRTTYDLRKKWISAA